MTKTRRSGAMMAKVLGRRSRALVLDDAGRRQLAQLATFRRQLTDCAPALDEGRFQPQVFSYCRLTILSLAVSEDLIVNGIRDKETGELRIGPIETYRRLVHSQSVLAAQLGLTPAAAARARKGEMDLVAAIAQAQQEEEGEVEEVTDDGDDD
jgi:hypothetical protein